MTSLFSDENTRIAALKRALPALDDSSRRFAADLIEKSTGRYGLSSKQWQWVGILTERAAAAAPEAVTVGIAGVVELLDRAAAHLKHPAIMVRVQDRNLRLSIAGPTAQVPGAINVCSEGGFADRAWYGRIRRDGQFEPSRRHGADTATAIVAALRALADDPAGTAAAYGRLMGVCCFCGIALSDERSTAVGYGRTCAAHYGLPYPTAAQARRQAEPALFSQAA